jgi:hypothetical protein
MTTLPEQNIPADQPSPPVPRKSSVTWIFLLLIFLILYIALNVWIYLYGTRIFGTKLGSIASQVSVVQPQETPLPPTPTPTPKPTPTPTPTPRPIPHGKMAFTSSQSDRTAPQLSTGSIDPYDPASGTTQTVTITVKHTQPVTKVTAVLKTDHKTSAPISFTLVSGTNTDGQWKGSWQVTDTYLYTYKLTLEATSGTKTGTVVITLR